VREVFLFGKYQHRRAPLDERWAERELFFWTAFRSIRLIVAAALAIYLIVCLATGADPFVRWLPGLDR
jgi:hypothetical protein